MYFKTIIIFSLILLSNSINAQELRVILTNGYNQHKEELIHPLTYKGYRLGVGVHYVDKLKNDDLFFTKVNLSGVVRGENRLQNDMSLLNLNFEMSYLFKTVFSFWNTGISMQAMYDYSLYSLNYEYPFWFTQNSLNWSNKIQIPLSDNLIISGIISLPLFGFFSRTEKEVLYDYKRDFTKAYFHKNLTFDTVNNFKSISGDVSIFKKLSNRTELGLGYLFHFFCYKKPKPISGLNNSISLNFKLKW